LVYVAGITIIVASAIALRQDHLKRRLAYSTISQLSYVVMGVALLTPMAILGATIHIAAHAVSKITLFFAAGAIYVAAHKTSTQCWAIQLRLGHKCRMSFLPHTKFAPQGGNLTKTLQINLGGNQDLLGTCPA